MGIFQGCETAKYQPFQQNVYHAINSISQYLINLNMKIKILRNNVPDKFQ